MKLSSPVGPKQSFRLPEGRAVEVVFVRLDDGRLVARTVEELEAARPKDGQGSAR